MKEWTRFEIAEWVLPVFPTACWPPAEEGVNRSAAMLLPLAFEVHGFAKLIKHVGQLGH